MIAIASLLVGLLCDCFKPRQRLEAEILVLRHQLTILQHRAPRRLNLRWVDRALLIWLYRRFPRIVDAVTIVRPETVVRWHRMGYTAFWQWKSRRRGGRPRIGKEVRDLAYIVGTLDSRFRKRHRAVSRTLQRIQPCRLSPLHPAARDFAYTYESWEEAISGTKVKELKVRGTMSGSCAS
jgi:hypothetical protein